MAAKGKTGTKAGMNERNAAVLLAQFLNSGKVPDESQLKLAAEVKMKPGEQRDAHKRLGCEIKVWSIRRERDGTVTITPPHPPERTERWPGC